MTACHESSSAKAPTIRVTPPGPKSLEIWKKEKKYITPGLGPDTLCIPIVFKEGKGSILWDVDGNSYIDFAAGILTNSTGNCHPKLVERLRKQIEQLWHVHDAPTPDRYKLLTLLAEKTPRGIDTFEFYSGGAETVEAAMRAAISYTKNYEFIFFHRAFHGKTLGVRSALLWQMKGCGPVLNAVRVPFAYCYRCSFKLQYPSCGLHCADYLEEAVRYNSSGNIAAIIFEPIIGGGGIIVPPEGFLQKIADFCRHNRILLIADEILTGVGRTGKFFAVEHFGIEPDLILFGKGLGSGFPVMVLGGRREIMSAEPFGLPGGASTTFGGNPLAIACALATLETIEKEGMLKSIRTVGNFISRRLNEMQEKYQLIGDVRGMGLLYGVELVKDKKTKEPAYEEGKLIYIECVKNGLRLIAQGPLIRFSPPLNIPLELVGCALDIFEGAVSKIEKKRE